MSGNRLDDLPPRDGGPVAARPHDQQLPAPAVERGRGRGQVARPFGFALTDPGRRLYRTRLFPEVTRIGPLLASRGEWSEAVAGASARSEPRTTPSPCAGSSGSAA